jgi:GR25 family glycosyltransferase involved in LPS biosynthesis
MDYTKAYVISMERDSDRRERFLARCRKAGLTVEWFNAIDGRSVDIADRIRRGYLTKDFSLRMPGSLGCLLSHIDLWEKIQKERICDYALIFEDDAKIPENFLSRLVRIPWSAVPDDWDMLWLGWHKLACDPVNRYVAKPAAKKRNSGHFAYMIKASSVPKIRAILLPYSNNSSKDVILRKNFDKFNAYFLRRKIVRHPVLFRESKRKNVNEPMAFIRFMDQIRRLIRKF